MSPFTHAAARYAALVALLVTPAVARAHITDAAGDFLPTYTGPANGDMDVLKAQVFFDGTAFTFTHIAAANIGTTANGLFVWGVDRGQGTARFPTLAPGVLFDWVLTVTPGASGFVVATRDLISGTATTLDAATVLRIDGATLTITVPSSLLPGRGFAMQDYTANLWPRLTGGALSGISDFAPDNSNFRVTVTPEPATLLLMGAGLAALLVVRRRRVS